MIGRDGPVKPFELIRWARYSARREHLWRREEDGRVREDLERLKPLEAHLMLVLATYADKEAVAFPSIKTLAIDCGLRPTEDGRNSAVSAALKRLEEMGLVWTKQGGHGRSARRELLFKPSGTPEGSDVDADAQPSALPDVQPSGTEDPNYQGNGQEERPEENGQEKPSALAEGSPLPHNGRLDEADELEEPDRQRIRRLLAESPAAIEARRAHR